MPPSETHRGPIKGVPANNSRKTTWGAPLTTTHERGFPLRKKIAPYPQKLAAQKGGEKPCANERPLGLNPKKRGV